MKKVLAEMVPAGLVRPPGDMFDRCRPVQREFFPVRSPYRVIRCDGKNHIDEPRRPIGTDTRRGVEDPSEIEGICHQGKRESREARCAHVLHLDHV